VVRDVVVTIPESRRAEVEAEEREVARREAAGEEFSYYWAMGRLPKYSPRRVYFVWLGAVRAYHEVVAMEHGRIYMTTKIHPVEPPIPMRGFMGFRYFEAPRLPNEGRVEKW
jgi:hypothetical protein